MLLSMTNQDNTMIKYTDGEQVIEAMLFEDNRKSAHYAFNIINDVRLDALVAPQRAIDYIMNNGRITLRNGESASHGDYIIKDSIGDIKKLSAEEFKATYNPVR